MMIKTCKIAVISDLHYNSRSSHPQIRGDLAPILLERTVSRLNRLVKPDVTLVLGDLVDDDRTVAAEEKLRQIHSILEKLESPYLAIPGNHDCDPDAFFKVFSRPGDFEEIGGVRFIPFLDREEQGANASRSAKDLKRFRKARSGFSGPLVALQHVCLFPPGRAEVPFNYTNASEIIKTMKESAVTLSVSGHRHEGIGTIRDGNVTFINAPGLCVAPFPYTVVTISEGNIERDEQNLAMDRKLRLFDAHVHTPLAYCNDNMDVEKAIGLADDFGLEGIAFTEHSGHLYFKDRDYRNALCFRKGISSAVKEHSRMADYLALKEKYDKPESRFGLEVDCDHMGRLLIGQSDRSSFSHILGAVHSLPEAGMNKKHFLFLTERLLKSGVDVLAHPFRIFRRSGMAMPEELFPVVAGMLKQYGIPAEINFHTNEPPLDFIRICLNMGVKFSFGSDAHHLSEIGDFAYHLDLLKKAGFDGELSDVLIPPLPAAG